jgi:hypothetical protein
VESCEGGALLGLALVLLGEVGREEGTLVLEFDHEEVGCLNLLLELGEIEVFLDVDQLVLPSQLLQYLKFSLLSQYLP